LGSRRRNKKINPLYRKKSRPGILSQALRQAQHGWTHISKSAIYLMIGPERIVRAIQDKRIVQIGNHADFDGYAALYVFHLEVCSILSPEASAIAFRE
jgi:hypothetical protein